MGKMIIVAVGLGFLYGCGGAKSLVLAEKAHIAVTMDLVNVVDDRVQVTVDPGAFVADAVSFYIPKTVPGTYSTDNYGQYIEDFKAIDYNGGELRVTKSDANTWDIGNGKNLDKVIYYVNDTFDTEYGREDKVFSPAGTNILEGENFMLNLHGFVGYFSGLNEVPYELAISHPANLKATTSLKRKSGESATLDVFDAQRYFEVTDNPILYAKQSPASFQIDDIEITISVYSPSDRVTAEGLKEKMEKMMRAQKAFLGEVNSTKEYNILLYLSTLEEDDASGFGALEHHTSTVVILPEQMPKEDLEEALVDVVSHEFFHTLTPLNVHSKEIQYFDFNDPKMSQHLWMYEGATEYFANLFQVHQGLIEETDFFKRIVGKIENSKRYDDTMSFTEMSKHVLVAPYKANYPNVYEKGALIGMALDISLRELSGGERGILWLMKELSKKYDGNRPFEDDRLIDEIVAMTYPEIRPFFDAHVIGTTPIDYYMYLEKVGLHNIKVEKGTSHFLNGNIPFIDVDEANDNAIFIRDGIELNSFLRDLGVQGGDVIKKIDGVAIDLEAIRPIIGESFGWSPDKEISIVVERNGNEVSLSGKAGNPKVGETTLVPMENASQAQLGLRKAWMKG